MKSIASIAAIASVLFLAFANPAAASLSFTYTNAADGNLTANFTIDVVSGYAVSGTGTVNSSFLSGTQNLNLVTYLSALPAGAGSINVTNVPVTNGFTWHGIPTSGGADYLADNVVLTPSPLYFDEYGIIFAINDASTSAFLGALNIFDSGPPDGQGYSDNFTGSGHNASYAGPGSLTVAVRTTVPEPAPIALLAMSLMALAVVSRRSKFH